RVEEVLDGEPDSRGRLGRSREEDARSCDVAWLYRSPPLDAISSSTASSASRAYAQLWHLKLRMPSIDVPHPEHRTPAIASGTSVFTNFCSPRMTWAMSARSWMPSSADETMSNQLSSRPHLGQSRRSPLTQSG